MKLQLPPEQTEYLRRILMADVLAKRACWHHTGFDLFLDDVRTATALLKKLPSPPRKRKRRP